MTPRDRPTTSPLDPSSCPVSDEMKAAGVDVLEAWLPDVYFSKDGAERLVEKVYLAMVCRLRSAKL